MSILLFSFFFTPPYSTTIGHVSTTLRHALHTNNAPLFALFLDAKSCFDKILFESVIVEAYRTGTNDQALIHIRNRLQNRKTYCEFDTHLISPRNDKLGVEQGGRLSDKYFRLCGNNPLNTAQASHLGIHIPNLDPSSPPHPHCGNRPSR